MNPSPEPSYFLLSARDTTAQKEHRCDTCAGVIRPGARYTREAHLVGGHFQQVKFHFTCNHPLLPHQGEE